VQYLLVRDPKSITFNGRDWISDGRVLLELDNPSLRNGCARYGSSVWKYE